MFSFRRFAAVLKARNLEFFRDKASLSWNLLFPVLLLVGFAMIFSSGEKSLYKVGLVGEAEQRAAHATEFDNLRFIELIVYKEQSQALLKLSQHSIDLVIDYRNNTYWTNELSAKSYFIEQLFSSSYPGFERRLADGQGIRYLDWVLPGILAMNMMFSCLFGVGYVIVRYRKNYVLKRLRATPLTVMEFVLAQLASRLFIVLAMVAVIYLGCDFVFDFYMLGSYLDLLVVTVLGATSLLALGLLLASRSKSEELVGGLLNLATWPMMLLSEVWFSLEGAPQAIKTLAQFLPLTHLVGAARQVIIDGASLMDVSDHLLILLLMTMFFLLLSTWLFDWSSER
jgi:ABC-type multidrug transport system permease subunit